MSAASDDVKIVRKDPEFRDVRLIAADIIYGKTLVAVDANGWANPGADTAGLIFIGVSDARYDNASGANGAVTGQVYTSGLFPFAISDTTTQANVGDPVYMVDDMTVALKATVTNNLLCGTIAEWVSANVVVVDIAQGSGMNEAATHIADATAAHTVMNLSTGDAGGYYPSDVQSAGLQLNHIASGGGQITIPLFTGWTKDGTAKTPAIPLFEATEPIKIVSGYVNLGTAPGSGKTASFLINTVALASITGTATQGEGEGLAITIAADTNIVPTVNETAAGAGANATIVLNWIYDDGV